MARGRHEEGAGGIRLVKKNMRDEDLDINHFREGDFEGEIMGASIENENVEVVEGLVEKMLTGGVQRKFEESSERWIRDRFVVGN